MNDNNYVSCDAVNSHVMSSSYVRMPTLYHCPYGSRKSIKGRQQLHSGTEFELD